MRSISISVTEAARNFADCISRTRYQGISFILHKNGLAVARIVPASHIADEPDPAEKPAERAAGVGELEPSRKATVPEIW